MDTNMTFRIDSEVKAQMNAICNQLGMTASTAFNGQTHMLILCGIT